MKLVFAFVIVVMFFGLTEAQNQLDANGFRAFDRAGKAVELAQIIESLKDADALFLGEQHDDEIAHRLQFQILQTAFERYGKARPIVLSMEMFERDTQTVVDEYLQDLINESNFITSSRAWNNYKTDYRPLVEFAKANKLPVVAANAPRRYVNRVSRLGKESLGALSAAAKSTFAPLPFADASKDYATKFAALMGATAQHNSNMLAAQSLWDATMADSIYKSLQQHKNALVINLNGSFHSDNRLGAPEHLLKYNPKARIVVVTIKSAENFPTFDQPKDRDAGDFVILTKSAKKGLKG